MKKKTQSKAKNIGVAVKQPEKASDDRSDPFYGHLKVRGNTFIGTVVKAGSHKTCTVQWERLVIVPKYERFAKRYSRVRVHNPPSIDAKVGDRVKIMETRPISKTKHFVVIEILSQEKKVD